MLPRVHANVIRRPRRQASDGRLQGTRSHDGGVWSVVAECYGPHVHAEYRGAGTLFPRHGDAAIVHGKQHQTCDGEQPLEVQNVDGGRGVVQEMQPILQLVRLVLVPLHSPCTPEILCWQEHPAPNAALHGAQGDAVGHGVVGAHLE